MNDPFRLDGRIAIVTGASSGLGARMALALANAGATVVGAARRVDRLQAVVDTLPGSGHLAIGCDLSDPADIERLAASAIAQFGRIDVLVNNAGYHKVKPIEDETIEDYDITLGINLRSPFLLSKIVGQHMLVQNSGSIINIASVAALSASMKVPGATYSASKGGIVAMTRDFAAQWSGRGVRINAICPGWFRTDLNASMFESEKGNRFVARMMPMARPGTVEELDGPVVFLASDASSYVTGIALPVDGGQVAT